MKQHALDRMADEITLGVARSMQARRERDADMGFDEAEQEFQVEVSGTGDTTAGFASKEIEFDYQFIYAPAQRDSDLEVPQFSYGFECDADIMLSAHVREWLRDASNGAYVGATVRVGVLAGASGVAYSGVLHLSFAGYGAPIESSPDI